MIFIGINLEVNCRPPLTAVEGADTDTGDFDTASPSAPADDVTASPPLSS